MTRSKQGQGISINTIIIVIIAVLVLALILVFATDSFSTLTKRFRDSEATTNQTDVIAIQAQCSQACLQAKNIGISPQWTETNYCKMTFDIEDDKKHCWESPINKWCEVTTKDADGNPITCDPETIDAEACSVCE